MILRRWPLLAAVTGAILPVNAGRSMAGPIRPFLIALAALAAPSAVQAQVSATSTMSGTASATVIRPISITATAPLRFGVMAQPSVAGAITVSTTNAVTRTGGLVSSIALPQGSAGPQAGTFRVTGEPGRQFFVALPPSATVTRSGGSMTITLFTVGALAGTTSGTLDIAVGGTLAVGARQAIGTYNGTYQVTASYN